MSRLPHALLVVENASVPMDRRVWNEARALANNGYRVTVIAPSDKDESRRATARHEFLEGVEIYRFPMPFGGRRKLDFLLEYGWAVLAIHALALRIRLKGRIDVIHVANPPDLFFGLKYLFALSGTKFVFDQHDLSPETFASKFSAGEGGLIGRTLRWLERRSYRAADAVIVTNESYRERAVGRGEVSNDCVFTVRNSPDLSLFERRPSRPELRRGYDTLLVFVGTMGHQDGVNVLLEAAARVRHLHARTDVGFVLIGTGDTWDMLMAQHAELGLGDGVWFTGFVPDDEMIDYLSSSDIGVAPDPDLPLNNVSTMIKTMDYMAMRLPIVSFDLVESRTSAGEAAIYATENTVDAFAAAIIELVDDPERRRRMSEIGVERIAGPLSWDHSTKNLLEAYDWARSDRG